MRLSTTNLRTTGFLFLLVAFGGQIEPVPANQDASQNEAAATPQATPAVQKPSSPAETGIAPQNQNPPSDAIKRSEWVQIFISGFVALVVLWQAWVSHQQRKIMQHQLEIARVTERAYIGITGVDHENFAIGMQPVLRVTILNGGRTPAFKLKAPATFRIGSEFPDERPDLGDVVGSAFLPAGTSTTFSYPYIIVLTPTWLRAFETGERTVFLNMEIHFEDCWGEPQVTPFRLEYRGSTDRRWGQYKDPEDVEPIITVS